MCSLCKFPWCEYPYYGHFHTTWVNSLRSRSAVALGTGTSCLHTTDSCRKAEEGCTGPASLQPSDGSLGVSTGSPQCLHSYLRTGCYLLRLFFIFIFLVRGSLLRMFITLAQFSSKDFSGHVLMVYSLLLLESKYPSIRELRGAAKSSLSQIPAVPFSPQAFPHTLFLPSSSFSISFTA